MNVTATNTNLITNIENFSQTHGMVISGTSPDNSLVEAIELKDHPWFVGTQFHPEYNQGQTDHIPYSGNSLKQL